jgi:thymidine phosphorylase
VAPPLSIIEIIRAKRDGRTLSAQQIDVMVNGMVAGASDSQLAAFAMATVLRGMSADECAHLTAAMTRSGARLEWQSLELPGPLLDKHSTGGVGDKVSLLLAPLLAACGAFVPMISGRGLGHTGGTLDKLEAIPGYTTQLSMSAIQNVTRNVGCVIVGASEDIAPADARLYAVRDVTATVESVPLVTSSILSKKMAAGIDALVMDVKVGSGGFTPSIAAATELARSLVGAAGAAGLPTVALLTDMNQVLGRSAGNAVEVMEVVNALNGDAADMPVDARLIEVTLALGAELLVMGLLASDTTDARAKLEHALSSGSACARFDDMVAALGGPVGFSGRMPKLLPVAPVIEDVVAPRAGFVTEVAVRELGLAVVQLGGGRQSPGAAIDHRVGLSNLVGIGDYVESGARLATVRAANFESAREAGASVLEAFKLARTPEGSSGSTPASSPQSNVAPILSRIDPTEL